jgi:hypothetical protein
MQEWAREEREEREPLQPLRGSYITRQQHLPQ